MNDRVALILVALVAAALCFAFMRVAGEWIYFVIGISGFAALFVDNRKLRKRVKELEAKLVQ